MKTNRSLCICLMLVLFLTSTGCGPSRPAVVAAAEEGRKAAEQAETEPAEPAPAAEGEDMQPIPVPFPRRIPAPEFPTDMEWMNTSGPVRLRDLRGKFVLLDFWTYCCINCIHILPELKKLEHEFPNELVVIGVHSAKFENEADAKNISEAILRYEIEHPVVNDDKHRIWNSFSVRSWPTMYLLDPEGNVVYGRSGEFEAKEIAAVLRRAIPYYEQEKTLDRTPIRFELLANSQEPTPLRFPGKVLADEKSNRLYIADSNHNRIVVADLDGKLIETIGNGAIGKTDGDYAAARFHHLQGMALDGETLYVADTENHLLRKVDLKAKTVSTIAGKGEQGRSAWPGVPESGLLRSQVPERFVGKPLETAINSPWALWVKGDDLYIAMAGPHQIWKMKLDGSEIGPYAGNGREDIVDGPLLPPVPYEQGYSSFAQPSGLTSDGTWLYVADSEGSSIRAVPFDPEKEVRTVTGSAHLPSGRLFDFGDKDGSAKDARLQHALGVCYVDGQIYIADTYNNKIRVADAKTGDVSTIAGNGEALNVAGNGERGADDSAPTFDEPAGLSYANGKLYVADTNNHLIRTIDLKTKQVKTLTIEGLTPPSPPKVKQTPNFSSAKEVMLDPAKVTATDGQVKLNVDIQLPLGWKLNKLAPTSYFLEGESTGPAKIAEEVELVSLPEPKPQFTVSLPVAGEGKSTVKFSLRYYFCEDGVDGLCKTAEVRWTIPLEVVASGGESGVTLTTQPEVGL
ncbi:thioredoxin-like domain-containing protein [Blastopirellula retiformator]|uniref:Thiol-disulfide oxidoreductase YkuV n=1 Tax=Blastopirellula retiformator TaxID=2527970 RepID=A0A5C5UZB3_9BACT|nr:thioredoxin-like domain-containing protein [Blastopirellula retiformator]TWT30832.1 Thiol-disulfide oxidoreductase YkuV [Blastopirellula retiformator]